MMFISTVIILITGYYFLCEDHLCKKFDTFWKITKVEERKIMFYVMQIFLFLRFFNSFNDSNKDNKI